MKTLMALFFTMMLTIQLYADVTDNATGISFPSDVSFSHDGKDYKLQATGVATRKKLVFKIYSVASYLQDASQVAKASAFDDILKDNKAKQLTLKFARSVPADKVMEGYHDSFKNVLGTGGSPQLHATIEKYIDLFNHEAKEGEEQVIRWAPGGYVEVVLNGKVAGTFNDPEFAKTLWAIWFGGKSVVNRDNLVSLLH